MGNFNALKFTNSGLDIENKCQTGKVLKFTKIALGSGTLGDTQIENLTELKNEILTTKITKIQKLNNKVTIRFEIDNKDLEEGFYWKEIGVFAEDPNTKEEKLFMYSNAGETADYIPPKGINVLETRVDIDIFISNVANITANIDTSMIFVSKTEYEENKTQIETNITKLQNDKANKKKVYNITIDTAWTGDTAPYTKEITVEGIEETDEVNMYPVWSGTLATRLQEREEYNKINMAHSLENKIKLTCDEEKPTISLNARLEVLY